jgi:SWI/SNF-related matrix-associated actin-dependent regulator 1 of chromatin subfamily A
MILTHTGKRFELKGSTAELRKDALQLGFTCSSKGVWYTGKPQIALSLVKQADINASDALEGFLCQIDCSRAIGYGGAGVPTPTGRELLPFQTNGILYSKELPACLNADEMGLGKTLQAIGHINWHSHIKRVAVCSPAAGKIMWKRALEAWLSRNMSVEIADSKELPKTDIVIFNYENAVRLAEQLDEINWDLLIFDEAHMLKNPDTQRTTALLGDTQKGSRKTTKKSLPGLRGKQKLFLSGTPIEKRPLDLWPIIKACDPQGLGSNRSWFETRYCAAHQGYWGWDNKGASNLTELNNYLRGTFMVRRLKKDVLPQLPRKRRQIIAIEPDNAKGLIEKERYYYETNHRDIADARAEAERAQQRGDKASYALAAAKLKNKQAVTFEDMALFRQETARAKLPMAISLIEEILANGEKLVVFGYHREIVNKIHGHFIKDAVRVDGGMSDKERQYSVDLFQDEPDCRLIVGTIPAMYSVYTLTAASNVLFVELDWRATVIKQAEDRLDRIGQTGSVLVMHLVFDGSIDALMVQDIVKTLEIEEAALD